MAGKPTYEDKALNTVSVPEHFQNIFLKAQDLVTRHFQDKIENPQNGIIEISGERYILVRAASMSVEFFDLVTSLCQDRGKEEAKKLASGLLFDIAHALGKADAREFHSLSAGPGHFAYSGWASIDVLPESNPTPDENYFLVYDHPFSFEAEEWLKSGKRPDFPVCILNAGYSSGWCEESFGIPLVAVEIECRAKGDEHCRFIMAPPSRVEQYITRYSAQSQAVRIRPEPFTIPEFFQRKRLENALRKAHDELERLQALLQQAQKMEAVGNLASGVAHDFNNLLMGIQGNSSLMLMDIDPTHQFYERLKSIEQQAISGSKLTAQFLGYARRGRYEVKPINLNKLVEETSDTFGRTKKEITIHREFTEDLFAIEADQGKIEQVLLNLYVNAADAMPGGGHLILKTMNITHEDMRGMQYDPKPGNYILLAVSDTGIGMEKKTIKRIFDLFFTTKEMGKGTGLGLASAYGIIKSHGGYIDVESEKGHGSTFKIYLPASGKIIEKAVSRADKIVKGYGTILLVDDEEMILNVGQDILEALGYEALTAKSGKEAIEQYKKKKDKISLIILDMIMPEMGGGETYDILKGINKDIKVILSSGYSIEGQATEILNRGCNGFIQKPFSIKDLSQSIRRALDSR